MSTSARKTPRGSAPRRAITSAALMAATTGAFFVAGGPALASVSSTPTVGQVAASHTSTTGATATPDWKKGHKDKECIDKDKSKDKDKDKDQDKADKEKGEKPGSDTKDCDKDKVSPPKAPAPHPESPGGTTPVTPEETDQSAPIPTAVSAGMHTTSGWEIPVGAGFVALGSAGLGVSFYRRRAFDH